MSIHSNFKFLLFLIAFFSLQSCKKEKEKEKVYVMYVNANQYLPKVDVYSMGKLVAAEVQAGFGTNYIPMEPENEGDPYLFEIKLSSDGTSIAKIFDPQWDNGSYYTFISCDQTNFYTDRILLKDNVVKPSPGKALIRYFSTQEDYWPLSNAPQILANDNIIISNAWQLQYMINESKPQLPQYFEINSGTYTFKWRHQSYLNDMVIWENESINEGHVYTIYRAGGGSIFVDYKP